MESNFSYHIILHHIILHHIISDSHVLSILYDAFQRQSDMLLSYLFSDKKNRHNFKKKNERSIEAHEKMQKIFIYNLGEKNIKNWEIKKYEKLIINWETLM